MGKSKKLKEMSIYEASIFWDEHDFTEFEDVKEVKDVRFLLSKKSILVLTSPYTQKLKRKLKNYTKVKMIWLMNG